MIYMSSQNEHIAVQNLQRYLRQLSFEHPEIPVVSIDGLFDDRTQEALRTYQTLRGFEPTGRADYPTWIRLYDDYIHSLSQNDAPITVNLFPRFPVHYHVELHDRHFLVNMIQYMLNELSAELSSIPPNEQNGFYDETTEAGVREFQKIHHLPPNGRVDRATWNAMTDLFNRQNAYPRF